MKTETLLKNFQRDVDTIRARIKSARLELKRLDKAGRLDGSISYKQQRTDKEGRNIARYARFIASGASDHKNAYIGQDEEKLAYYEGAIRRHKEYVRLSRDVTELEQSLDEILRRLDFIYQYSLKPLAARQLVKSAGARARPRQTKSDWSEIRAPGSRPG